jgi:predicted translin family RNA/ssDNA-binding protein
VKWTHFSADIVRVCKELINALEQNKIQNYQMREVDATGQRVQGPVRVLNQVKEKISKYDMFLQNNKTELENRDLAASINQEAVRPI